MRFRRKFTLSMIEQFRMVAKRQAPVQSMKTKAADKTADTAVKAGVQLEKARGKMGGKLDGVIDKAEEGLAKVHDKAVEKRE